MGKLKQRKTPKDKQQNGGGGADASSPLARSSKKQQPKKLKLTKKLAPSAVESSYTDPSIISLFIYLIKVLVLTTLSLPFWFLTGLLSLIFGRPPKLVRPSQTWRFLRYTMCPNLSLSSRIDLTLTILLHTATSPVSGFCWLLDEILYGRQLNSLSITQPLFVLSAYRSASTEMARTLANDKRLFIAPTAIMCAFPYLWVWKLILWIIGDDYSGLTIEEANGYLNKNFTKESLERHDNNHFEIDTFDGYFLSSHLNGLAYQLGPEVVVRELHTAAFIEENRSLFEECFVDFVDRIARKTMLFHGLTSQTSDDRMFLLKGHFLQSANVLQRKYPDARFLTVLRDPMDRLKSGINHMAVNATLWQGKAPRWDWLAKAYQQIEVEYCVREMEWYGNNCSIASDRMPGSKIRNNCHTVNFDKFVKNFDKTMKDVYKDLLQEETLSDFAAPSKVSTHYTIDRTLHDLGVDEAGLKSQLSDYYAWVKKQ